MRIKIKDIPESGLPFEQELDRAFLGDALDGTGADLDETHAHAELRLERTGDNVFARGVVAGMITLPCSRCLRPASLLVSVPLRMTFAPEDTLPPDDDVTDDVEFATHDGERIDLAPVLRETLILTVPMTPLCREDCKGLCPVCGKDRNVVACGCSVRAEDPRFAALKGLKI